MRVRSAFAAAAAIVALSGAPAAAATVTFTYEGFVSGGFDATGVFGPPLSTLDDLPFTAVFTRHDAVTPTDQFLGANVSYVEGPGVLTATLTINGITESFGFDPSAFGRQYQFQDPSFEQFTHRAQTTFSTHVGGVLRNFNATIELGAFGVATAYLAGADYRTLEDITAQPDFFFGGSFSILEEVVPDGGAVSTPKHALALLIPTKVTVTTAVPQPNTWALMILGFGLAGTGLRRRVSRRCAPP